MGLPKAVQEQLDQVEQAIKETDHHNSDESPSPIERSDKPTEVQQTPIAKEVISSSPEPEKQDVAIEPTILSRHNVSENVKPKDDWEHKYLVLQGMFRKANEQNKQLVEQVRILEASIESEKIRVPETVSSKTSPDEVSEADVKKYYSPEDIEEMGMDWCKRNIQRMLRINMEHTPVPQKDPDIESIKAELAEKKTNDFYAELARLVPDWAQVNATQAWVDFLNQILPEVGVTYMAVLDDAKARYDAKRVALLFDRYKQSRKQMVAPQVHVVPPVGNQAQVQNEGSMTFEQWHKEYLALPGKYSNNQERLAIEQKRYDDIYASGKVIFDSGPQSRPGFI